MNAMREVQRRHAALFSFLKRPEPSELKNRVAREHTESAVKRVYLLIRVDFVVPIKRTLFILYLYTCMLEFLSTDEKSN